MVCRKSADIDRAISRTGRPRTAKRPSGREQRRRVAFAKQSDHRIQARYIAKNVASTAVDVRLTPSHLCVLHVSAGRQSSV